MRALAILALLFIGGCVYYFGIRRVDLSGSSPIFVDVHIPDVATTNVYDVTITNRAACEALVKEIRHASPTFGGSKVVGTLTFRYTDGKTNMIYILSGPSDRYTLLKNGTFTVATNSFSRILADGGVDLSQIP